MNKKPWVTIMTKKEYTKYGIPEIVGIYYNPYNDSVRSIINDFILPEFHQRVYGWKHT